MTNPTGITDDEEAEDEDEGLLIDSLLWLSAADSAPRFLSDVVEAEDADEDEDEDEEEEGGDEYEEG